MSYPVYVIPASTTLYHLFDTFAGSTGAPITMSGFAVGDLKVYKNGSTTERSSTAGFTLLDTDGIDFDSITGIQGFSIDLSDNTDAGFYAVGSWYHVVVSTVTVDSQTMSFIACAFRIVAAEGITGKPKVDVDGFGGSAGTFASGIPEVKVASIAANAITATSINADAITNAKIADDAIAVENIKDGAITAAKIASDAITAAKVAADVSAEIADAVWDEAIAGHAGAGSTGEALSDAGAAGTPPTAAEIADAVWEEDITDHSGTTDSTAEALAAASAAGDPWNTSLPGAYSSGKAGYILGTNLDAAVSTRASQSSVDDIPTNSELATALGGLNDIAVADILGAVYEEAETFQDFMRLARAVLLGGVSGQPSAPEFLSADGMTTRVTASVDGAGNRSSVVVDAS